MLPTYTTPLTPFAVLTSLRSSDFEAWSDLYESFIVDFEGIPLPPSQLPKTWARLLDPEGDLAALVVRDARDETKLWGFAIFSERRLSWTEKGVLHINDLYVEPEVRNRGYGAEQIRGVGMEAEAKGYVRVTWVTELDSRARERYERLGAERKVEYRFEMGGYWVGGEG